MNSRYALISLAVASIAGPAFAADDDTCPLSYEVFEYSVPHTDMEECPAAMESEGTFCRVAVVAEVATIFAFSEESGCITKSKSFDEDQFEIQFE